VHVQCDIIQCNGKCDDVEDSVCADIDLAGFVKGGNRVSSTPQNEDGMFLAASSVFVLDPADALCNKTEILAFSFYVCSKMFSLSFLAVQPICEETGQVRPYWLLWLTIALGVLFLIMLLMNIFLCTAMSCSCARTEVSITMSVSKE
jgi:hypothetical protein